MATLAFCYVREKTLALSSRSDYEAHLSTYVGKITKSIFGAGLGLYYFHLSSLTKAKRVRRVDFVFLPSQEK